MKIASDVDSSSSVSALVLFTEKLLEQRRRPTQRTCIDLAKTQYGVSATLVDDRLRSTQKPSNADSS